MRKPYRLGLVLAVALLAAGPALAEDVKVGAVYPLSGNAANAGKSTLDAVNLAVELVNGSYPELAALPSVGKGGLSNLGGAKTQHPSAYHDRPPEQGQIQTIRL